jgi:hypothetical protein
MSNISSWHKWLQRFDRFRSASGLEDKSGVTQVNSLIYSMGPEADDIFAVFLFSFVELCSFENYIPSHNEMIVKFFLHFCVLLFVFII